MWHTFYIFPRFQPYTLALSQGSLSESALEDVAFYLVERRSC